MSIKEQIMADVKSAMKNKEAERLATLRFVHAAIKNREIELRPNPIDDKETMSVLKKLVKQRKDSISQYSDAKRQDLVDKEQAELEVIETYLPEQMSPVAVEKVVVEAIQEIGADSMKHMGGVMKLVMEKTAGAADNKVVSDLVKAKLNS